MQLRDNTGLKMTEDEKIKQDFKDKKQLNSKVIDKKLLKLVYPHYLLSKKQILNKKDEGNDSDSDDHQPAKDGKLNCFI